MTEIFMSRPEGTEPLARKQAQIFPTETCNLRCDECPYPYQSAEKKRALRSSEIDPAEWKTITDFLYSEGIRLFCTMGGEPASYKGIDQVIANITVHPDAFVLFSTSGIHLLHHKQLRELVGRALAQPEGRESKNGIVISFDGVPTSGTPNVRNSRALKAKQGLRCVELMQKEFSDQIIYVANVMVTPDNLSQVLEIQAYLEQRGVFTNLCTQQGKCFGKLEAVFDSTHVPQLTRVGAEMIKRKINGNLVVNSVSYLSQFPGTIGMEGYHCWEELEGNPVIDVGPRGEFRYCNWIGQEQAGGPPGVEYQAIMTDPNFSWGEFWAESKRITAERCRGGCSWSRRDRGLEPMVEFNPDILIGTSLPDFDPEDPRLQNIWVQAQRLVSSS